jgi:hypothetical protein
MARCVVALPKFAEGVLAPNIPDLEIHIRKRDGGDILAYSWDGAQFRSGRVGEEKGFDLFVECRFACIVKTQEEN